MLQISKRWPDAHIFQINKKNEFLKILITRGVPSLLICFEFNKLMDNSSIVASTTLTQNSDISGFIEESLKNAELFFKKSHLKHFIKHTDFKGFEGFSIKTTMIHL